ncbi:hypothetical protein SAMN05216176_11524 [Nitratireductor indicus]|jgi:TRAP-type C4-dicarboxylate transport system permease small subunit|nr:hypothetical protein SAMN05216176_11524 [Nitratireductor indicus]
MPEALECLPSHESLLLARKRRRMNWVLCVLLVTFVVAVYWISFSHVRTETNETQSSSELGNGPITHA